MLMILSKAVLSTALASGLLTFFGISMYLWTWGGLSASDGHWEKQENRRLRLLAAAIKMVIDGVQASVMIHIARLGVELLFGAYGE